MLVILKINDLISLSLLFKASNANNCSILGIMLLGRWFLMYYVKIKNADLSSIY